ncbi:hypothetical protein HMSSN036_44260 [Paenibacillus macerans]|nr:hypothetical protein HMSSN036_44260 [Paenibacillus macerans]
MTPGDGLQVFETEKGTVAMLTCYDIEFPEIVRMAKAKGADVISVLRARTTVTDFTGSVIPATPERSKTRSTSLRPVRSARCRRWTSCGPISGRRR